MNSPTANRLELPPNYNLSGHLLVASPAWQHELFGRAVCLVVHHSAQGAIGVVLNRHIALPPGALLQKLAGDQPVRRSPAIHFGGPQAGPVVAVHDRADLAEFSPAAGVYLAAQIQNLRELVMSSDRDTQVKIMIGQADWGASELDSQFAEGKWLPLPVTPKLVFADDSEMWHRAMHGVGDLVVASLVDARVQPECILTN